MNEVIFDAGDVGCGELVMNLRIKFQGLAGGDILRLIATDSGAPEDIPAWFRDLIACGRSRKGRECH